nr:prepilin-type N-terminal cleavage/methylation domain-containing protein [Bacteriovorax sp. HI3]
MKISNHSGFSLAEILIAMGLLSVLSLGVSSSIKMMAKGQATSETKMEELELRRQIVTLLADKLACQNTMKDKHIGDAVTQIKGPTNQVLFQTGSSYGNNSLKILQMLTKDNNITLNNGAKSVELIIHFEKMKKIVTQATKAAYISMAVITDSSGSIVSCYSDAEAIISSATSQSCTSLGGTWNGTACLLPTCGAGQVLQGISDSGAICKTLICGEGEILKGINNAGEVVCVPNVPTYQ